MYTSKKKNDLSKLPYFSLLILTLKTEEKIFYSILYLFILRKIKFDSNENGEYSMIVKTHQSD